MTKKINGNNYLYAKSTKRPKDGNVEEKYLGTPDDVVAIVDSFRNPPQPQVVDREFGAVAALWSGGGTIKNYRKPWIQFSPNEIMGLLLGHIYESEH